MITESIEIQLNKMNKEGKRVEILIKLIGAILRKIEVRIGKEVIDKDKKEIMLINLILNKKEGPILDIIKVPKRRKGN